MTSWEKPLTALAVILAALMAAVDPARSEETSIREYLDETTAATISVATEPLVFAHERTDLAVNARDYVSLVPIEVNRTGQRSYYWSGYVWSTIDRRDGDPIVSQSDEFVLIADGRPIQLLRDSDTPRQLGIAASPTPSPVRTAVVLLFPTDPELLSYVSAAEELKVRLIRNGQGEEFLLWRDGRRELRNFVSHLGLGGQ